MSPLSFGSPRGHGLDLRNFPAAVWRFIGEQRVRLGQPPPELGEHLYGVPACRNEAGERDQRQMEDEVPLRTKNRER